jgi:hypothetical protein
MSKHTPKPISKHNTRRLEQFPYEIVIPITTDVTAVLLRDTTLMLCKAYKIPSSKIWIFLAEKKQQTEFQTILIPGTFGRLIAEIPVNEIFPVGTQLIFMSPGLTGFFEYDEHAINCKKPLKSLLAVIKTGFYECEKTGAFLWGIQKLKKNSVLKSSISHGLKLISSFFYGCIYTGIDSKLGPYDDIERSILYFKHNTVVVRCNMFGFSSIYRPGITEKDMKRLEKLYPDCISLTATSNGLTIKLRKDPSKKHDHNKKDIA